MSDVPMKLLDGELVPMTEEDVAQWEADANRPEPVPGRISKRQMKLGLLQVGLLDQVEALIAQADRATQIEWADSGDIYRSSPVLNGLASHLQPPLSSAQVDDLFRLAATL